MEGSVERVLNNYVYVLYENRPILGQHKLSVFNYELASLYQYQYLDAMSTHFYKSLEIVYIPEAHQSLKSTQLFPITPYYSCTVPEAFDG